MASGLLPIPFRSSRYVHAVVPVVAGMITTLVVIALRLSRFVWLSDQGITFLFFGGLSVVVIVSLHRVQTVTAYYVLQTIAVSSSVGAIALLSHYPVPQMAFAVIVLLEISLYEPFPRNLSLSVGVVIFLCLITLTLEHPPYTPFTPPRPVCVLCRLWGWRLRFPTWYGTES